MILYNTRSTLGILLRFKGTALAGIGPLWVLVVLNVFESIAFLHYGAPPIEGKTYLDILAKVLVFLLVFRCRLAFDRFWSGRVAVADLGRSCLQMVSDISVFVEQKGEEDTAFCLDLYRRALSTFMCMNIHLRKHHSDLAEIHSVSSEEDDDGWSPDAEARQFTALVKAGLLTKEEKKLFLQNGMAYVTIAATMFSQKLKDGFQMKMMHRNLMLDIDGQMREMVSAWYECYNIAHFPFPFPYIQALTVFNLVFVLSLPIALVQSMGPWTPLASGIITVGFFGLDAVGSQLEDPFGTNANNLDLDELAQSTCDACFVALRARDGNRARKFAVRGIIDETAWLSGEAK